jgi:hypothetical protein
MIDVSRPKSSNFVVDFWALSGFFGTSIFKVAIKAIFQKEMSSFDKTSCKHHNLSSHKIE